MNGLRRQSAPSLRLPLPMPTILIIALSLAIVHRTGSGHDRPKAPRFQGLANLDGSRIVGILIDDSERNPPGIRSLDHLKAHQRVS